MNHQIIALLAIALTSSIYASFSPNERVLIDDSLQGKTSGQLYGGQFSNGGYQPVEKTGHILYKLPETVSSGYMEFEIHGMTSDLPENSAHAFFGMYDGRGLEEPVSYFYEYRENHYRFNGHWRQNRNAFKALVSSARPSQGNRQKETATFELLNDKANRDWCEEPTGSSFDWQPDKWHKFRVEWGNGHFQISIDGQTVWTVENGPYKYAPVEQRLWLGSAPGKPNKHQNELPGITYRNFKLVSYKSAQPSTTHSAPATAPWTQPLTIDPAYPHHFHNAAGKRSFIFNKTAWHYFSCQDPDITLDRANRIGANVIRVHLEGHTYYEDLALDAWPWGGTRETPDFSSFNEPYWNEVEKRIQAAAERGIGLNLTLFMKLKLPDQPESFEKVKPYLQGVINRLAKYPNIFCWEVHNEHSDNPNFQAKVGRFMKANDPYKRPVISSNGTTDNPLWPHADWMDMALIHHCTGTVPSYDLRDWYLAIARNLRVYGKPAFNNEPGREKRHQNNDPVHRRKQLWIAAAAGGYTTWHSWDGCEGIDDPIYQAQGEQYIRPFVDWWSDQEFWKVDPTHTLIQLPSDNSLSDQLIPVALASQDKDLVLAYFFTRTGGTQIKNTQAVLRLSDGLYQAQFYNPADGAEIGKPHPIESTIKRGQIPLTLPDFSDDLALKITRTGDRKKTEIQGTQ